MCGCVMVNGVKHNRYYDLLKTLRMKALPMQRSSSRYYAVAAPHWCLCGVDIREIGRKKGYWCDRFVNTNVPEMSDFALTTPECFGKVTSPERWLRYKEPEIDGRN